MLVKRTRRLSRRPAVILLVAAMLIGCVSGAGTAVYMVDWSSRHQTAGPVAKPSKSSPGAGNSGSSSPPTGSTGPGNLLYVAGGRIHDGTQSVPFRLSRNFVVSSVQRAGSGWLLVQIRSDPGDAAANYGTYVDRDGRNWDLGPLGLTWDIDPAGRIFYSSEAGTWTVANPKTHRLKSLPLIDGPGEEEDFMIDTNIIPGLTWARTGVLTSWSDVKGNRLALTSMDGSTHTKGGPASIYRAVTSSDGKYAVGGGASGNAVGEPDCLSGGKVGATRWWQDCKHERVNEISPFSPDSRKVLTVVKPHPRKGIGKLAVLDSKSAKPGPVLDPPRRTYSASWLSDDELVLLAGDPDGTSILYRLTLGGRLTKVKELTGDVVLGISG